MPTGLLARLVETPPGQVLYRLATLPLVRPLARRVRRGGTLLAEAVIRHLPAHRRHDARQRAILAAFEAETARHPPPHHSPPHHSPAPAPR